MQLKSTLKFRDFKGIRAGQIDLYPLTILLGSNNSAKTTILEAIYLYQNPLRITTVYGSTPLQLIAQLHSLDSGSIDVSSIYRNYTAEEAELSWDEYGTLGFINGGGLHYVYYYEPGVTTYPQFTPIRVGNKDYARPWIGRADSQGSCLVVSPGFGCNQNPLPLGEPVFFSSNLIGRAFNFVHQHWISVVNSGISAEIAKDISDFSYEEFEDFTDEPFMGGRNAIYAYRKDRKRVRVGDLGAGIQDYVAVRMLYEFLKPKFILWDDAEAHLNPRVILRVAEWLSSLKDTHVVLTTHSLELAQIMLDQFDVCERGEDARAVLLALRDGELKSKTMIAKELKELKEAGVDARLAEGFLL